MLIGKASHHYTYMSAYFNQTDVSAEQKNMTQMTSLSMPLTETVIVCFVVAIISLATTVGNLLVLIAVHMDKKLRTVNNLFIASLAVSDLLVGMFLMPSYTTYTIQEKWLLGSLVCDFWLSFEILLCTASNGNLLAICCDRYLSITRPFVYRIKRTPKRIKRTIVLVWAISILVVPPWIFAWPFIEGQRTVPETECYIQFLVSNVVITVITMSSVISLPMMIMLVLYLKIYRETERCKQYKKTFDTRRSGVTRITNRLRQEIVMTSIIIECNSAKNADFESDKKCTGVINDAFMPFNDTKQDDHSTKSQSVKTRDRAVVEMARAQTKDRDNRKAAKMLTVILVAFFVTYFPYYIFVIIKSICSDCIPMILYELGYWTCYLNSMINPFIYAHCNVHFRKAFWKILSCAWWKRRDSNCSMPR